MSNFFHDNNIIPKEHPFGQPLDYNQYIHWLISILEMDQQILLHHQVLNNELKTNLAFEKTKTISFF